MQELLNNPWFQCIGGGIIASAIFLLFVKACSGCYKAIKSDEFRFFWHSYFVFYFRLYLLMAFSGAIGIIVAILILNFSKPSFYTGNEFVFYLIFSPIVIFLVIGLMMIIWEIVEYRKENDRINNEMDDDRHSKRKR